jgi:hypothetical protein
VSPRSVGNTEREAAQWRAKLASKQVVTVAQPYEPPRHTPTPEAERILTVDLASARAQAQEAAPATSCEGGGGNAPPSLGPSKTWPQWPRSWTCYRILHRCGG